MSTRRTRRRPTRSPVAHLLRPDDSHSREPVVRATRRRRAREPRTGAGGPAPYRYSDPTGGRRNASRRFATSRGRLLHTPTAAATAPLRRHLLRVQGRTATHARGLPRPQCPKDTCPKDTCPKDGGWREGRGGGVPTPRAAGGACGGGVPRAELAEQSARGKAVGDPLPPDCGFSRRRDAPGLGGPSRLRWLPRLAPRLLAGGACSQVACSKRTSQRASRKRHHAENRFD